MQITVSESGLMAAIRDGLEEMEDQEADGFSYPIGKIKGMVARLVVEPEGSCNIAYLDDDTFCYSAVCVE